MAGPSDDDPKQPSYVGRWARYRRRHHPAALFEGTRRVLAAGQLALDAWQDFFGAAQSWSEAAVQGGYALDQVIPDVLTFQAGWVDAAQSICNALCHPAAAGLVTNEESEMAGPLILGGFTGPLPSLVATSLVCNGFAIPASNVMLRITPDNELMITLVGLRTISAGLPPGTYRGDIRRASDNVKIADIVNVHSRIGQNLRLTFGGSGGVPV